MSREEIVRQIVILDLQKKSMSADSVQTDNLQLYEHACELFGTWETALKYAGIDMRRIRVHETYSREWVLQQIGQLCRKGYNLRSSVNMRRDRSLYDAARRNFGTWRKALQAAGVNLQFAFIDPKTYNKQEVLKMISQRHSMGLSLMNAVVYRENRGLAAAAKYRFGSWSKALQVAGIKPEDVPSENSS